MTIYWIGSPKFTPGHPAPFIALVHHRMVGTLRSTDAAFTATDGREASTHFGIGYGCGRTGHPTGRRAVEWLRALGESLEAADVGKEKADLMHAIYDRIAVAGPDIVGVQLTQAAYAHGLALALPEKVEMARPTGV